ncbi:MAG: tetratricopeptide repeat protein, partial [Bacteroidota bacterium]
MRRILTALLLFGCSLLLTAQTMEQFVEDAEKQHKNQNYYGAYDSYRIAAEFDESRMDFWYNMGENARLYTAYGKALDAYQHILTNGDPAEFPELRFRMGQAHQSLGNYEEAADSYRRYLEQGNGVNQEAAQKNLSDSEWSPDRMAARDTFDATHLPAAINTKYSDFAYRPETDSIFFTSNRVEFEKDTESPPRFMARIFRVMRNGDFSAPGRLTHKPTEDYVHMAHTSFTADKSRVYYTMCEFEGTTEIVRCDLYFSNLQPNSPVWGPPNKMAINVAGANNSQPHVAFVPDTGVETLFFASNRAGGKGGMDLYMAPLNEDGSAGTVTSL